MSDSLQMFELLLARLCHDLITPVGAIELGLGIVSATTNSDENEEAIKILAESQQRLAIRLKMFRLLSVDTQERTEYAFEELKDILSSYCLGEKVTFLTRGIPKVIPTTIMKFMIAAVMILLPTLVRGGHMVFEKSEKEGGRVSLLCTGQGGRVFLREPVAAWFAGNRIPTSQTILCFLAEAFAKDCGASLHLTQAPEKTTLFLDMPPGTL
ncbi:MAG: hypothetical protein LBQ26_02320 [Holosporales bacterium]|jgi:histidine phosphotransferase ChpT|nr:hypothetical protein [Holosporales bacterium]